MAKVAVSLSESALDVSVAEYNMSMAHAALNSNLSDEDALSKVINRIYLTWPESYAQIEQATVLLSRIVLRDNRAREYLAQELKRMPVTSTT